MNSKFVIFLFAISCTCAVVFGLPVAEENHHQEAEENISTRASCVLPMDKGICRARMPRWRYDPNEKDCVVFHYGGCLGNANNFFTKEECVEACKGV